MLLGHLHGDGIDEPQNGARMSAAFFLLHSPAAVALAPSLAVILRDGVDAGLRVLLDPFQYRFDRQPQHVGIRQTELRVITSPLAVDKSVVFGMLPEVLFRGEYLIEGVNKRIVDELTAR